MSSDPPHASSPSSFSVKAENLHLAYTLLSLPATPVRQISPSLPRNLKPRSSPSSPPSPSLSSASSWTDVPAAAPTSMDFDRSTGAGNGAGPSANVGCSSGLGKKQMKKKRKGVRAGFSNLPEAPSPFGCQLGNPALAAPSREPAPYHHAHRYDYFYPRPSRRALSVENGEVPRPDPNEVYDTLLSAWSSIKDLTSDWIISAIDVVTEGGKKDLTAQLMKGSLFAVIVWRPRWLLGAMNISLACFRDPFRFYHHSVYLFAIHYILR